MKANNAKSKAKVNTEVSQETEATVENNIPNASDKVKQKTIEIMDVIKIQQKGASQF